jgi:hypothetical protein
MWRVLPAVYTQEIPGFNELRGGQMYYTSLLSLPRSTLDRQFPLIWVELVQPRFMPQLPGTVHFICEVRFKTYLIITIFVMTSLSNFVG